MREILFRGKRVDNGEWVEGYCVAEPYTKNTYNYGYILENEKDLFAKKAWLVDSRTVGQFTGLTDKNGKKVFEGDIVDITQYDNVYHKVHRCCKSKVFFSNFAFRTNAAPDYEDEEPLSYWFWHDCDFEVIGNIHDNPELLEVTK